MTPRRQRGHTLAEALVGLTVGLLVVAAAIAFVLGQLREVRASWIRDRLVHELRDAADVIQRDLRRAGHWQQARAGAWSDAPPASNPHAEIIGIADATGAARWSYSHDGADDPVGFRLRSGVIETQLGGGGWQALTDAGMVVVTALRIAPTLQAVPLASLCPRDSAAPTPALSTRSTSVVIEGHAVGDPGLARSVHGLVQVRNDLVTGACPT